MNIDEVRDYGLSLPFATERSPFGPDTLALEVGGRLLQPGGLETACSGSDPAWHGAGRPAIGKIIGYRASGHTVHATKAPHSDITMPLPGDIVIQKDRELA